MYFPALMVPKNRPSPNVDHQTPNLLHINAPHIGPSRAFGTKALYSVHNTESRYVFNLDRTGQQIRSPVCTEALKDLWIPECECFNIIWDPC